MITWVRSTMINHGKHVGAIEWALRASAYTNDKFGTNVSVHANVAGLVNEIRWVATFDSLAAFEEITGRIVQDEGYINLLAESSEAYFFDTHSFSDVLYRSLP